jgi:hypothetical protein
MQNTNALWIAAGLLALVFGLSLFHTAQAQENAQSSTSAAPSLGKSVTASVGVVGKEVVTSREVKISSLLEQVFEGIEKQRSVQKQGAEKKQKKTSIALVAPSQGSDFFRKALNKIMVETVVLKEAEALALSEVSADEVESLIGKAMPLLADNSVWLSQQVTDSELRLHVQRKLRTQSFLKFKTQNSGVQISDGEAEKYFDKNRVKFGGLPFSQFKDQIKKVMAEEVVQTQLEDWFELLRRKYRVRLLSPTDNVSASN